MTRVVVGCAAVLAASNFNRHMLPVLLVVLVLVVFSLLLPCFLQYETTVLRRTATRGFRLLQMGTSA